MRIENEQITDMVLKTIEDKGLVPWTKDWVVNGGFKKHSDGSSYSIRNCMLLMAQGEEGGEFIGYQTAIKEGGHVKKGEHGKFIAKVCTYKSKTEVDENGEPLDKMTVKWLSVFNVERQCEGIELKYKVLTFEHNPIDSAEKIASDYIAREGIKYQESPVIDRAYFSPTNDSVQVPPLNCFRNTAEYYSARFHELVHSTGTAKRLNRHDNDTKFSSFGSEDYSFEELVAELGSIFLLSKLGIKSEASFRNSSAYLKGWSKALKDSKDMLMKAARQAEQAMDYILNTNSPE